MEAHSNKTNETLKGGLRASMCGERKDRTGKSIKKGSKKHHITFRDEVP